MLFIVGLIIVVASVLGGYMANGGHLGVLWQPFEFVIIFGGMLGAFVIASPKQVLTGVGKAFSGTLIKGPKHGKDSYMELIGLLYSLFKLAKTKGDLALEGHIEKPHDSALFAQFPKFLGDHHAVEFLCDYLRLLTLGTSNAHEVGDIIDHELEIHHDESHAIVGALSSMADGVPALGIVAAVLGVIHTMGSITEPPEVLGHLIGGALVGTFSGILMSYGFMGPVATSVGKSFEADSRYFTCIKTGIIAHMQGYAPQVSVEFARKTLGSTVRPTFAEVEEMIGNLPSPS
ncbi:MAG: flagellar motor stator protein MotA [Rhodospirillales bacterium RIFCSPLOWO2_12_FULL_58_28]|nr:MAG: flagellar motor stator protein MotA [Rhodospirillales bacterium RIFCSPLOWO2_02_FULL_58_16]OHC77258.1 MAG: flagellar motor stator protein MotA [Rhodospirillales bacterium RIFCSPLOWO2_12_FULL_58_28]